MQAITQTHICLQLQELLLYFKHMCKRSDGVEGKDNISSLLRVGVELQDMTSI